MQTRWIREVNGHWPSGPVSQRPAPSSRIKVEIKRLLGLERAGQPRGCAWERTKLNQPCDIEAGGGNCFAECSKDSSAFII